MTTDSYRIVPGGTVPTGWVIERTSERGTVVRLQAFANRANAKAELDRLLGAASSADRKPSAQLRDG